MAGPKFLIPILALLLSTGCVKDRIALEWSQIPVDLTGHLNEIDFDAEGNGYIVGGLDWSFGLVGSSMDAGKSWRFDSLANKRLYDLFIDEKQEAYAVGVDGYLFSKKLNEEWRFHRLPRWDILRAVAFNTEGEAVVGGGAAFANGILINLKNYGSRTAQFELDFEISDVAYSNDKVAHAVGYGVILRSEDDGENWISADVEDDFFQAIEFVNDQTAYVVGLTGSILKTIDAGESWTYLRNPATAAVKNFPFRDIHFINEQQGFICGEQGLLWHTSDAGENWSIVKDLPTENFLSVSTFGDHGYLVGEDGILLRFLLP